MENKILLKPSTILFPLPAVMVSCGNDEINNIITISWTGTICSEPPMCYISVRPERFSYHLIKNQMDFVINLTNKELAYATDWCGVKSGRDHHKFTEMGLTPVKSEIVKSPLIAEAPVNIECIVSDIQLLGSHAMFIANVVAVHANASLVNERNGAIDLQKINLIAFSKGHYQVLGESIGTHGFSTKTSK